MSNCPQSLKFVWFDYFVQLQDALGKNMANLEGTPEGGSEGDSPGNDIHVSLNTVVVYP